MTRSAAGLAAPRRAALFATAAVLTLSLPTVAVAQDTEEAQPAGDMPSQSYDNANEIVVTATKREQTLQDVPVAVTVTTAATLEREHIRDLKDLSSVVPSLHVGERQASAQTNFFIRGFGNGANNVGVEPSVGVFIDGVYRSRTASQIADFPDVERIEVLRGPQSTLFGKNASAGVISITTERPKFDFGGNVEASYGNYDAFVVKGVVTGPIADTLAVSLAGGYNKRDGYNRDLNTGARLNERNRWFVRGQLLFEPDSQLKVRLIGDYGKIDEDCCGVVNVQQSATSVAIRAVGGRLNDPADKFDNVVYNNFVPTNRIKNYGVSGQVDYEIGPVTLTSITAYRETKSFNDFDPDYTSADIARTNASDQRIKTFTQELRATATIADKLTALIGAYYFNEKIRQDGHIQWGANARGYFNLLVRGAIPGLETMFGVPSGTFFAPGQGLSEFYSLNNEAVSVFGQLDLRVADRLTLTGGLNYTHDNKRFAARVTSTDAFARIPLPAALAGLRAIQLFPPFLNVPNSVEPGRTSDNNVSYTARASFDVTDQINFYAGVATGFKASSVNLSRDSRPPIALQPAITAAGIAMVNQTYGSRTADPEKATSYEAGIKANWGLVTANLAVFKESIRGFQSNIFTGTGFFLGNAGKESVFGIEFEGTARPVKGLTLGLGMTYLKPRYDDFKNSAFGDATGFTPAYIPPISATFSLQYDHELGNSDHVILYGNFHYESPVQLVEGLPGVANAAGNPQAGLDAARQFKREVNDLNGSLTYAMHNGLELSVWGRNLLDKRYLDVIFDSVAQAGSISAYTNPPRTYGVSARFRW